MRRSLLFLFSLVLAPLAMHADQVIQANGSGSFNCFQAYPREGFGDDLRVSMSGKDRQGNYMSAQMDVGQLGGLPTCTATLPSLFYEANFSNPREGSGSVNYNGITYGGNTNGVGGCSSGDPNVRCDITFSSSGSGDKGSIDVVLSYWTLTFDDQGNIIDESTTTTVDLGGNINFYSLGVGEQLGFGDLLYPYSYGSFTMADAPEPADWSLMLCATPLAFVYMRRKKRA